MNEVLPDWHRDIWRRLSQRQGDGRLPHALLFYGVEGVGKRLFARRFSQSLLCSHTDAGGEPCGSCHACQVYSAGNHPDFHWLEPEETGKAIRIDAVRELCRELALTPQFGHNKIAVIAPADRLNSAAANALLKTLEEPPDNTLLILVSSRPGYLPATIRSRCQACAFPLPEPGVALRWLEERGIGEGATLLGIAQGAPFLAAQLAETDSVERYRKLREELYEIGQGVTDPVKVAANYSQSDAAEICRWMLGNVMDMIRLHWLDQPCPPAQADTDHQLHRLAKGVELGQLFELQDALVAAQRQLETPVNTQLLLEDLFLRWMDAARKAAGHAL